MLIKFLKLNSSQNVDNKILENICSSRFPWFILEIKVEVKTKKWEYF